MEELGIIKCEDGVIELTDIKSKLENSSIYNFVNEFISVK